MSDQETILENKLGLLNKELLALSEFTNAKLKMKNSKARDSNPEESMMRSRRDTFQSRASMTSFYENQSTLASSKYFKKHEENMSRLKKRK